MNYRFANDRILGALDMRSIVGPTTAQLVGFWAVYLTLGPLFLILLALPWKTIRHPEPPRAGLLGF
jgi:hypothetical protein